MMFFLGNDAYLTMVVLLKLCDPMVRAAFRLDEEPTQEEIDSYPRVPRGSRAAVRRNALSLTSADILKSLML